MIQATRKAEVQELELVVDLDERGSFRAHVGDQSGATIFEFSNEDDETGIPDPDGLWLVECGFMRHSRDTDGLLDYLKAQSIVAPTATLILLH